MSCESYIKRLYKSHDWDATISTLDIDVEVNRVQVQYPSKLVIDPEIDKTLLHSSKPDKDALFPKALYQPNRMTPMPLDCIEKIYSEMGYKEGTTEHKVLEEKAGFAYQTLLGEILYTYMTCRLDIEYAVTTLSKFSSTLLPYHYKLLKCLAQYLHATVDWEICFKRTKSLQLSESNYERGFVHVSKYEVPHESEIEEFFKADIAINKLIGFCDVAHANDLRNRRSTTAIVFTFMGGTIVYKSKTQSLTAGSSTKAEFIAAHAAGKVSCYLRFLLKDLGYKQSGPTPIYIDNLPALQIINNNSSPTDRTRHIHIRYFALQDWRQDGDIITVHIPGIVNLSDPLSKPVGFVLHSRHCRHVMGHYYPP